MLSRTSIVGARRQMNGSPQSRSAMNASYSCAVSRSSSACLPWGMMRRQRRVAVRQLRNIVRVKKEDPDAERDLCSDGNSQPCFCRRTSNPGRPGESLRRLQGSGRTQSRDPSALLVLLSGVFGALLPMALPLVELRPQDSHGDINFRPDRSQSALGRASEPMRHLN